MIAQDFLSHGTRNIIIHQMPKHPNLNHRTRKFLPDNTIKIESMFLLLLRKTISIIFNYVYVWGYTSHHYGSQGVKFLRMETDEKNLY